MDYPHIFHRQNKDLVFLGHTPTKALQHCYFSLASCSQWQATVFIPNVLTYSFYEGHTNAALITFYDQHNSFTGLLNNISSIAYFMKLIPMNDEKMRAEKKWKMSVTEPREILDVQNTKMIISYSLSSTFSKIRF